MADPRSWLLLQAMLERLKTIRQASGFHTDAGDAATDEPAQQQEKDGDFLVAPILEATRRSGDAAITRRHARGCTIGILAMVKASRRDAQFLLHQLLDDIDHAFPLTQPAMQGFPCGISYPRFVDSEVLPKKDGMKWIAAIVRFESEYTLQA